MEDAAALRRRIEARYGSVHRFCKACPGLGRSTVYQVLAGRYPGNAGRQLGRLREALGEDPARRRAEAVYRAIKETACRRCAAARNWQTCGRCDTLYREQAQAALAALEERA